MDLKCSQHHNTEKAGDCGVMHTLASLIVVIISQCVSKYVIHLTYVQFYFICQLCFNKSGEKNELSLSVPLQEMKAMILNLSPKLLTLTYDPYYEQMSLLANSIE